jgi:butyrate response factor 1
MSIKYRTKICKNYENGYCQFGDECLFAHGKHKLKEPPLLEPCWFYNVGECTNGDNCPFVHVKSKKIRKPLRLQKPCWEHHVDGKCENNKCKLDHFHLTDDEFSYHFPHIEKRHCNSHSHAHKHSHAQTISDEDVITNLVEIIKYSADRLKNLAKDNPELYNLAISRLL